MIRANGSLSLVHSASTVTGFEWTQGKTLFYGYYGGVYIGKNLALDANGKTVIGYGPIASDGQNRAIQEITFGTNTTLMKDSEMGRPEPDVPILLSPAESVACGRVVRRPMPMLSMGFFNLRYTLPGSAPHARW